jgi:Tol biopolymer transport system component
MKTKIKNLLGAILLLMTLGTTQNTAAQAQRIVFDAPVTTKTKAVTTTTQHIFSMDDSGANLTQLTSSNAGAYNPRWSPDRQYVAFMRNLNSQLYVYVMDAIGEANGSRTFLVAGPVKSTGLDWAPDGRTILFSGYPPTLDSGIWAVSVNPATAEVGVPGLVRPGGTGSCHWPACSPDGTKLAFANAANNSTLMALTILDLATGHEITSGQVPSAQPSWHPAGDRIAFAGLVRVTTTARNGKQTTNNYQEIFLANADLTGITQVTDLKSVSAVPTWDPLGTEIAFASQVSAEYSVYKKSLDTGALTFLHVGNHPDWLP